MINKPREKLTIKKTAIPTIAGKQERRDVLKGPQKSRLGDHDTVVKFLVTSFDEPVNNLNLLDLKKGWVTHDTGANSIFFCKVIVSGRIPSIERALNIDDDLNTQAFYLEKHHIPLSVKKISYVRQIETIIHEIDQFSLPPQNVNLTF